jgi:Ca-activated chloride channel family protein
VIKLWHTIEAIHFAYPWVAWLALAAPVVVGALHVYDRMQRRRMTARLGELPVIGRVIATTSPARRLIKDVMLAAALALLVLAVARPQLEGKRDLELRGLDLVVAIDVSKSMLVDDVGATDLMRAKHLPPSRLERARELATWVIDELPEDRVAPMVFASAVSHFPLTEDHEVATRFLNDLGPADLPPGSNLGEVLRVARCLLRPDLYDDLGCARIGRRGHGGDPLRGESLDPQDPQEDEARLDTKAERGKAIVIFTDGGDPDVETIREVTNARELGIAVLFVGVGTEQGGIVYDLDPFSRKRGTTPKRLVDGSTVISKRNDPGMRALAEAAGDPDRYIVASERGELDPRPIVNALRAVNRGLATKRIKEQRDVFEPFVFTGFMLLVIEVAISTRRRRAYPEAR